MILLKQKAFTLAEILLVAGIVALIGSIILILSKGAIEKAKIAKALNFDAQIYHAFGIYTIGDWNFDEGVSETCAGGNDNQDICDTSGYRNHGTLNGNVSWTEVGDTPSKNGRGLIFEGGYVNLGNDSSLDFIALENYTYTGWFKSNDISQPQTILDHSCDDDFSGLSLLISDTENLMVFSGISCDFVLSNSTFKSNSWYHFAVVYKCREEHPPEGCQADIQIYINGSADGGGENIYFSSGTTPNAIAYNPYNCGPGGCADSQYWYFNGLIDNIRIYNEALSSAQIKKLYATISPPEGGGEF